MYLCLVEAHFKKINILSHARLLRMRLTSVELRGVTLHEKLSFPLRIFSINVTKFAVSCGFGTSTGEILNGKLHFFGAVLSKS